MMEQIDEEKITQEFNEAARAFTESGDETPIRNFCMKYNIKYTSKTIVIDSVEESEPND